MSKSRSLRSTTIAILDQTASVTAKITKIVPYKTGGFAVLAPYHAARKGYLAKHKVDYRERTNYVERSKSIEYSADDRVKLSLHRDGFVQFSGERSKKIVSGRDPITGEPRGLGILLEYPLYQPILSGPTFSISVWGISEFKPVEGVPGPDFLVFSEDEFYYRDGDPNNWGGYVIEGFLFPNHYWGGVRSNGGKLKLSLAHSAFQAAGAVLDFAVVPLPNQPVFLGILVNKAQIEFPAPSGFVFSSPSDRRRGEPVANSLMAIYPNFMEDPPSQSLTFNDPQT